ncbi:MAG: oxidoreductase [Crocinitomicaceae bacterium]|nr:oxidoreductase [Crocinitomicaceae bacterium]|tara:strand:- start:23000 stop:24010 length:1011 start_codon:yes stop_codon:yes gene_type:complete
MHVKFGIVGCGHIASRHAKHIVEHPNAELVGVFDKDESIGGNFAKSFGTTKFNSYTGLLDSSCDIVAVCTPSGLHREHSISAFGSRKHVLVEKPMALSYSDAIEMRKESEVAGKELFVVKQNRYNPPVQKVKSELEQGKLGDVYQVVVNCYWNRNDAYYSNSNWKGTKALDGGVLFNQFSHFIDIVYYLFGSWINVSGNIKNCAHQLSTEFEDSGNFTFILGESILGSLNFTTNSFGQNMEGSITIFAENATIKIGGKYLNAIEYIQSDSINADQLPISAPANNYGYYEGSMSNHDKVIDNVVKTLQGKEQIMTTARDGVEVVDMIEKLYSSAIQL